MRHFVGAELEMLQYCDKEQAKTFHGRNSTPLVLRVAAALFCLTSNFLQTNKGQVLEFRYSETSANGCTKSDADRLGVEHRTRYWAHAWVRERMSRLPLHRLVLLDAGSGTSNPTA